MPPTTPYAGKFSSCSVYNNNNHHPQPQSPYNSNTAPKPSREHIHNGVYPAAENPYDVPQPHHAYRSSSVSSMTSKEHHYSSSCVVSENPYSPQRQPHSPRQHSTSCPGRAHRHSSNGEHSCRNNVASVKSRLYGQGITASYGEMCYHDNSLVSASLEALIQHLVPTVDYYPDVSVCQPNLLVIFLLCQKVLFFGLLLLIFFVYYAEVIRVHLPAELTPLSSPVRAHDPRMSPVCGAAAVWRCPSGQGGSLTQTPTGAVFLFPSWNPSHCHTHDNSTDLTADTLP